MIWVLTTVWLKIRVPDWNILDLAMLNSPSSHQSMEFRNFKKCTQRTRHHCSITATTTTTTTTTFYYQPRNVRSLDLTILCIWSLAPSFQRLRILDEWNTISRTWNVPYPTRWWHYNVLQFTNSGEIFFEVSSRWQFWEDFRILNNLLGVRSCDLVVVIHPEPRKNHFYPIPLL